MMKINPCGMVEFVMNKIIYFSKLKCVVSCFNLIYLYANLVVY